MLNYLKAELYKLLHQRLFCVSLSLLLLLEGLMVTGLKLTELQWTVSRSAEFFCAVLPFGFFLIYPLGTMVFSEQYKHNTLKNEISFGLPRGRVYLGKLLASAIACLFACAMVIVFFLGASLIFFPIGPDLETSLTIMGFCLLIALPLWLGSLSLLHMLQFTIKSTTLFTTLYIAYFMAFEPFVWLLASSLTVAHWQSAFGILYNLQLSAPLGSLTGNLIPVAGWAWLVGVGWLVATTALGLFVLHKKDIK